MPTIPLPNVPVNGGYQDVINYLIQIDRVLQYLFENGLDSENIFEVGGWRLKPSTLISKDGDVGMSTEDTTADDIRFFAGPNGETWFFYVTKTGKLYATDAFITGLITGSTIIGGVIKTAETGARIELVGGVLKGYSEANNLHGLVFSPIPATNLFDLYLYHDGAKLLEFIDNVLGITIKGSALSVGMTLGGSSAPTFGAGSWTFTDDTTFNNTIDGSISGNAATANYASNAGTAAAADSLAPSGNIAWGQVLKSGSNLADLATKNLSSLTEDTTHRTVSDSEKSTWNAKWGSTTTSTRSAFRAYNNAPQTLTLGNPLTKILFQVEEFDNLAEYSPTTSRFTAAESGIYSVNCVVRLETISDQTLFSMHVYKNSASYGVLDQSGASGPNFQYMVGHADVKLAATDYLEIFGAVYTIGNGITGVGSTDVYFSVTRIA